MSFLTLKIKLYFQISVVPICLSHTEFLTFHVSAAIYTSSDIYLTYLDEFSEIHDLTSKYSHYRELKVYFCFRAKTISKKKL